MRQFFRIPAVLFFALPIFYSAPSALGAPRVVILFIGDGMGFEHVRAAGMYAHGEAGTLGFESWPARSGITTAPATGLVTDSAASTTAMATGVKVDNAVLSVAIPGDGAPLMTALEEAAAEGRSTGLVVTSTITHATPAAFAAHVPSRFLTEDIAEQYLVSTRPALMLGGGGVPRAAAAAAGYTVVTTRDALFALDPAAPDRVLGRFGSGHLPYEYDGLGESPSLAEMTRFALDKLDHNPAGFFLMVEGSRIDHAAHGNDFPRNVLETLAFAEAVEVAKDWARGRQDTIIIVTADHETGALEIVRNNGAGVLPDVIWGRVGHSPVLVPLYAWTNAPYPRSEHFYRRARQVMDNTEVHGLLVDEIAQVPAVGWLGRWVVVVLCAARGAWVLGVGRFRIDP